MIARRAKIVCTLGPAVGNRDAIRGLIEAGMDVARLNFSHGTHADHAHMVEMVRAESAALGKPVALLQDLCGPKIRTGKIGPAVLNNGDTVELVAGDTGDDHTISIDYEPLKDDVRVDDRILLSDGQVELRVLGIRGDRVECRVEHGGPMRPRMGVNLPSSGLRLAALTEKDKRDLDYGLELGVDYIALSFVRRAEEIQELREICERKGRPTPIIAKIETPSAVERLDSIVRAADAAMVARGDLGVELPPETVPVIQKQIIGTCRIHRKPVIVATEMLQSMVDSPRPTRAEASDVAHAVFGNADAVMLSAESASGKFPIQAVRMMDRIIRQAEGSRFFAPAASGLTARLVSKARPSAPILAFSTDDRTLRRLALYWGVSPRTLVGRTPNLEEQVQNTSQILMDNGLVKSGERYVMVYGARVGVRGATNAVREEQLP